MPAGRVGVDARARGSACTSSPSAPAAAPRAGRRAACPQARGASMPRGFSHESLQARSWAAVGVSAIRRNPASLLRIRPVSTRSGSFYVRRENEIQEEPWVIQLRIIFRRGPPTTAGGLGRRFKVAASCSACWSRSWPSSACSSRGRAHRQERRPRREACRRLLRRSRRPERTACPAWRGARRRRRQVATPPPRASPAPRLRTPTRLPPRMPRTRPRCLALHAGRSCACTSASAIACSRSRRIRYQGLDVLRRRPRARDPRRQGQTVKMTLTNRRRDPALGRLPRRADRAEQGFATSPRASRSRSASRRTIPASSCTTAAPSRC
jgi:hypothetical protein